MKADNTLVEPAFSKNTVPLVFASNDHFVPYLSVLLCSILDTSTPGHNYDIIILSRDITEKTMEMLESMTVGLANFSLRFVDMSERLAGKNLFTGNRSGFTADIYSRLFIPYVLSDAYDRAIYMDGDMLAMTDVAELMDIDLEGNLLASTRDLTGLSACAIPETGVREYREKTLGLKTPEDYIISGLLVMDLSEFRRAFTEEYMMTFTLSRQWRQHDQDILNVLCDGRIKLIDDAWDVMRPNKTELLPQKYADDFRRALEDPKIVHYGGDDKPWKYYQDHFFEQFWDTAARSPFYYRILRAALEDTYDIHSEYATDLFVRRFRDGEIGLKVIFRFCLAWIRYKLKGKQQ